MTRARDLANLGSLNLSNTYVTQSSASTIYAAKTSPVFAGTANFANASVIFNSASVSGLSTGGGTTVNSNLLYNGAMQIHQRVAVAASATNINNYGDYISSDRWYSEVPYLQSYGTVAQSIENDAPAGSGFRKSLRHAYSGSDVISGSKYMWISQKLEGQDCQAIRKGTASAKSLTLSFWVKSNLTGLYIAELVDTDNTRYVSQSYTVSSSNTWEFKTVTFPPDTTGVLNNDNGESLRLNFWMRAGSNFSGGASLQNTWGTTTNTRAVGQVDLAATAGNYWQVTGVKLEIGTSATDYDFKPFQEELRECQRYFEKSYSIDVVAGTNTVSGLVQGINGTDGNQINGIRWIVPKRTTPTITSIYSKTGTVATLSTSGYANAANAGSWNISDANEFGFRCIVGTGGLTSGTAYNYHYICSAEL